MNKTQKLINMIILVFTMYSIIACTNTSNIATTEEETFGEEDGKTIDSKHYLAKFDTDEGSSIPSQKNTIGTSVFEPLAPNKTGYTFDGWFLDTGFTTPFDFTKSIYSNITIYAKWKINIYTVTFNNLYIHNTLTSTPITKQIEYKKTVTPPNNQSRTGYSLLCWYSSDSDPFDFTQPITKDTVINARWKINKYTVTFDSRGGSYIEPQEIEYMSSPNFSIAKPTKPYSDFIGWEDIDGNRFYLSSNNYNYNSITSDITLYAIWHPFSENTIFITILPQSDIEVQQKQERNILTFSVNNDYSVLGWYLDNQEQSKKNIFTLNTSTLQKGIYVLVLEATKNGSYYSYTAQIKVD